jgi:hypothetical protein
MATALAAVEQQQAYEETNPDAAENRIMEAARPIIGRLDSLAREQVGRKVMIEQRWLENLRLYFGHYTDGERKAMDTAERSTAFVKMARVKTDGWAARLGDMLHPTDDRNWGIQPTPLPKLSAAAKKAMQQAAVTVESANAAAAAGNPEMAEATIQQASAFAQAAKQTNDEIAAAKEACDAMQEAIDDQLIQSQWVAQSRDAIEDGCRLGTGILKGPLTSNRLRQEWRKSDAAQPLGRAAWMLEELPDPQPEAIRVDPWHFFPDMSARRIEEAEFTFERSLPTKRDLRKYAKKLGFNKDAVRRLITEGAMSLNQADIAHIAELRAINGEGEQIKDRYVMWEYHGPLECDEIAALMEAAGRAEDANRFRAEKDPLEDFRVIVHFCNNEVLRIAEEWPLDSGASLYSVWNFAKGETSIFGIGVPHIMADSQRSINGAWRMMNDNAALSVGPQIVIDKAKIEPQGGRWDLKPLKVWLKSGTSLGTVADKPFEVFNIPNNQNELAGIIEIGKAFIEEETAMPQVALGESGASVQPVGTTSMLFNSANVVFRRVVKAWDDDITAPTIRRFYDWNMQFNPDDRVKGDMQVDARGTSVLLVKEMQSMNLLMIMNQWTMHPVLKHFIKVREGLVKTVQTMMIPPDDILEDQDTAEQNIAAEQKAMAAAAQQQGTDPNATRLQIAQMDSDTKLQLATLEQQNRSMEYAMKNDMTIAQVNAELAKQKMTIDSSERKHAADIAVEERRASVAREQGGTDRDATGVGVG